MQTVRTVSNFKTGNIIIKWNLSDGVRKVSDNVRKVSDNVRKVSEGVRNVSDNVRKVSEGVRKVSDAGHDKIPAQNQSTALKHKLKDQNTIISALPIFELTK